MSITNVLIPHHGRTVHAVFYRPDSADPVPAVLMSHGYNGCKTDFDGVARLLMESGVASLCYTFCGGSTRDESGFPSTEMTLFTEREDALALLDWLSGQETVDASRIFLYGGSMGGLVSVMTAAVRPQAIKGMALLFPALCVADNWRERFPVESEIPETVDFWGLTLGRVFFTSMRTLDVFTLMPGYEGPVCILQGDADPVVSMADSERACTVYPNCRLHVFPGEGHGFRPEAAARSDRMLRDFILENL